jgi:hypothetical protein
VISELGPVEIEGALLDELAICDELGLHVSGERPS